MYVFSIWSDDSSNRSFNERSISISNCLPIRSTVSAVYSNPSTMDLIWMKNCAKVGFNWKRKNCNGGMLVRPSLAPGSERRWRALLEWLLPNSVSYIIFSALVIVSPARMFIMICRAKSLLNKHNRANNFLSYVFFKLPKRIAFEESSDEIQIELEKALND